ncbi:MAG: hypothetical protein R6V67_07840 [Spirochaetia bacterium]
MKRIVSVKKLSQLLLLPFVLFVLAGCSQMSLFDLVKSEQKGDFSLDVESVSLKVGTEFNFSSVGGYLPYTYAVKDGTDTGEIDPETGIYAAPEVESEATVEVDDGIDNRDSARVFIYEAIIADPASFSLRIGDPDHPDQDIFLSGGEGSLTASAELGEITPSEPVPSGSLVTYIPDPDTAYPATDYIDVVDERGNSLSIKAEVLPAEEGIDLEILPFDEVVLSPGETQMFNITNNTGNSLTFELSDPSFGDITVPPEETSVEYTAASTEGAVFLNVTEDVLSGEGDTVQAEIYVQEGLTPLAISPESVEVSPGTTVEFTASGGKMPYTFEQVTGTGTLDQTSPITVDYTPDSVMSIFKVIDAAGDQAKVRIQVK